MEGVQNRLLAGWRIAKLEQDVARLQADLKAANASRVLLKEQRNALQRRVYELQGLAVPES